VLAPLQAAVLLAQLNHRNAQLALDELRHPAQVDVVAAQSAVESARSGLASAEAKLAQLTMPEFSELAAAQEAVAAARSQISSSELKLAQVAAGPTAAELAAARSAVESAESGLRSAEARLQQTIAGALPADLAAAQSALVQAQMNLDLKLSPYTEADIIAQQQAVTQAEANLAAKLAPSMQHDIEAQRQAVRSAEESLALKRSPYVAADVAAAAAALEQAEVHYAIAQNNLIGGQLTAPFDGIVSAIGMAVGEHSSGGTAAPLANTGQGSGSNSNSGAITVVDTSKIRVDVQVDEADIANIAVGQPATVAFDALANRRFTGQVVALAPSGTTTQGVVGYQVSIELDRSAPPGAARSAGGRGGEQRGRGGAGQSASEGQTGDALRDIRPGMTATATITYAQRDDALQVPNRAITRQGRDRVVQVSTPNGVESRKVQVGMANDQVTEITDGLQEGDEVIIPTTATRAAIPGARQTGPGGGPRAATTFGGPGPVIRTR
jgi:multidrug efflux pump subunit AcrA (membrane-fusion protein)